MRSGGVQCGVTSRRFYVLSMVAGRESVNIISILESLVVTLKYTPPVWSSSDLAEILGCQDPFEDGGETLSVTTIEFTADMCRPGALYFPRRKLDTSRLKERMEYAFSLGAVAAVVDDPALVSHDRFDWPVYFVKNNYEAMLALARAARKRFKGDCIAVTGSVGKTTVKEMTGTALAACIPTVVKRGNFNVESGVLGSLASTPQDAGAVVIEVSTIVPGAIKKRAKEVFPTVGVITNVGISHGGKFEDPAALLKEKLSILDNLKNGGVAIVGQSVIDLDTEELLRKKSGVSKVIVVGTSVSSNVRVLEVGVGRASTHAKISVFGTVHRVFIPVAGEHFAECAAFALAVCYAVGVNVRQAAEAFRYYRTNKRRNMRWRVNFKDGRRAEFLDDSYNAAPASVSALLGSLKARSEARRKVFIFGDMLELGGDVEAHHLELVSEIKDAGIALLVTVGPLTALVGQALGQSVVHVSFEDSESVAAVISDIIQEGDLVAMKGSNGMKLDLIAKALAAKARVREASPYWSIEDLVAGR